MEDIVRKRAAARGWVSRQAKVLDDVLEKPKDELSSDVIQAMVDKYDKYLMSLEEAQGAVEMSLEGSELDADLDEAWAFDQVQFTRRTRIMGLLKELSIRDSSEDGAGALPIKEEGIHTVGLGYAGSVPRSSAGSISESGVTPVDSGSSPQVKLPKLEICKFKGDYVEWEEFWENFKAHVDESNLPKVSKLSYLKSLLEGKAKSAIKSVPFKAEGYDCLCIVRKEIW